MKLLLQLSNLKFVHPLVISDLFSEGVIESVVIPEIRDAEWPLRRLTVINTVEATISVPSNTLFTLKSHS